MKAFEKYPASLHDKNSQQTKIQGDDMSLHAENSKKSTEKLAELVHM